MQDSARSEMALMAQNGYRSIAFSLIGAGSDGGKAVRILEWMRDARSSISLNGEVRIVPFKRSFLSLCGVQKCPTIFSSS